MASPPDDTSGGDGAATRLFPRGRLKIFLGPSPGVGKTFAMLQAASERKAEGVDVVVGLIETHKRKETQGQLEGLEILPRKTVSYRGHDFEELDLDGIIARTPKLVLIDECAHSNLPGSRHPKRYNDIEEILGYGIDVYTTLNIQHLESLKDIIGQMTGVAIRESIPDSFVHSADEIQLIDLPPDDLLQRLADGKVYIPEQVQAAKDHFFSRSNLLALRELALRHTVAVADEEMAEYVQQRGIKGPWPASDKVMVYVGTDRSGSHLVRIAHRVAERLQAKWIAVTVETPDDENRPLALQQQLSQTLHLAETLGAKVITLEGTDIADTLVADARARNVTDLIIGQSLPHTGWQRILSAFSKDLPARILARHPPLTLRVIPAPDQDAPPVAAARPAFLQKRYMPYLYGSLVTLGITGGVMQITRLTGITDVASLFFLGIVYISLKFGTKPALVSCLLSSLAYGYYYAGIPHAMHPYLLKSWLESCLPCGCFILGALAISSTASPARNIFSLSQGRLSILRFFADYAHRLTLCTHKEEALRHLCRQLYSFLKIPVIAFWDNQRGLVPAVQFPATKDIKFSDDDTHAIQWTLAYKTRSGHLTDNFSDAHYLYLPIKIGNNSLGVVGIWAVKGRLTIQDFRVAQALIDQAALAIDRLDKKNASSH